MSLRYRTELHRSFKKSGISILAADGYNSPVSKILYLHGFASGPQSRKGRYFANQFAQIGAETAMPDLNEGDFRGLTITRQLKLVDQLVQELRPSLLIGSSMGGYLAALYGSVRPELAPALVLMAPAFGFPRRWAQRLGEARIEEWRNSGAMEVEHFGTGEMEPIGYQLYDDAQWHDDMPHVTQPTLVFHGLRDEEVDPQLSVDFARGNPNVRLELLNSDHGLTDQMERMWTETARFYRELPYQVQP